MKKFILSAIAVGALAVGGVAKADLIDSVGETISSLTGIPYDPTPPGAVHTYTDAYGRHFYLDANRQPVYIGQNGPYGPPPDAYASGPMNDRDGDGVANGYDRYPDDPRYR